MPITTIGSYAPTMQAFIAHWQEVNAVTGTEFTLRDGYTVDNLTDDRADLLSAVAAVQPADNDKRLAADTRDARKRALHDRLKEFNAAVRYRFLGAAYPAALPRVPTLSRNESLFFRALDDANNLWLRINANSPAIPGFTPPFTLRGNYTQLMFQTDLIHMHDAYVAVTNATQTATYTRAQRNLRLPDAKAHLVEYRQAVLVRFPANSPLVHSLPAVSPPPGSTPAPVSVSGVWNAALQKAVLTWTPSDNPALAYYSVRTAPLPKYKAENESVVAEVPKTETSYATSTGLVIPGATALFRVYVVLDTANERGSATVAVTRAATLSAAA